MTESHDEPLKENFLPEIKIFVIFSIYAENRQFVAMMFEPVLKVADDSLKIIVSDLVDFCSRPDSNLQNLRIYS